MNLLLKFLILRNDDNYIAPGEEYELFYHNGTEGWKSLGKQTAASDSLVYDNIPSNTMLWLHNLTKGKEEQQFIVNKKNGTRISMINFKNFML